MTVKAVYEAGVLRPLKPLDLTEGQEIDINIPPLPERSGPSSEYIENLLVNFATDYGPTAQPETANGTHDKATVLREMERTAPDPRKAAELLAEIAAMSIESPDGPETGSIDHDRILYGGHGTR